MERGLSVLYRGPLASCNYGCGYCPFAKRHDTAAQLAEDRRCLERFVDWVAARPQSPHSVLFTPWGEALTRPWYRDAMVRLSHLPHVQRVAAQTNLSMPLHWVAEADPARLALWCTYHPGEVTRAEFVGQCGELSRLGIRHSVGVVGLHEHLGEISRLRDELPAETYVWVNAYKRAENYYNTEMLAELAAIDPLFSVNLQRHATFGEACRTGDSVISVDGHGDVRRCHFIADVIGNIYDPAFADCLRPRVCTNQTCGCHIGYVHVPRLQLYDVFGPNVLERIPAAGAASVLPVLSRPGEWQE